MTMCFNQDQIDTFAINTVGLDFVLYMKNPNKFFQKFNKMQNVVHYLPMGLNSLNLCLNVT